MDQRDTQARLREELQALFDALLDSGYITQFDLDIFHDQLSLRYYVDLTSGRVYHTVVFKDLSALYYQYTGSVVPSEAPDTDETSGPVEWLWAGYNYYSGPVTIGVIDPPQALADVRSTANFVLDLMAGRGTIVLQARRVVIDGRVFDVG